MPKGHFPKLKGVTVNVPVDVSKTIKKLSCTDGLILLKLKKKLSFKCHIHFEPFSRTKLLNALTYLKAKNPPFHDITIDLSQISNDLMNFSEGSIDSTANNSITKAESQDFEEISNPLNNYKQPSKE